MMLLKWFGPGNNPTPKLIYIILHKLENMSPQSSYLVEKRQTALQERCNVIVTGPTDHVILVIRNRYLC